MTKNQIDYWNLQEIKRANLAKETENYRSNKAKEDETQRSNLAKEGETNRANLASEGIAFANLGEQTRSHMAQESLTQSQLNELIRHQMVNEAELVRANMAAEAELARHNRSVEGETHRANVVSEAMTGAKIAADKVLDTLEYNEERRHNRESERNAQARNQIDLLGKGQPIINLSTTLSKRYSYLLNDNLDKLMGIKR